VVHSPSHSSPTSAMLKFWATLRVPVGLEVATSTPRSAPRQSSSEDNPRGQGRSTPALCMAAAAVMQRQRRVRTCFRRLFSDLNPMRLGAAVTNRRRGLQQPLDHRRRRTTVRHPSRTLTVVAVAAVVVGRSRFCTRLAPLAEQEALLLPTRTLAVVLARHRHLVAAVHRWRRPLGSAVGAVGAGADARAVVTVVAAGVAVGWTLDQATALHRLGTSEPPLTDNNTSRALQAAAHMHCTPKGTSRRQVWCEMRCSRLLLQ
jgi:hypothetical protein